MIPVRDNFHPSLSKPQTPKPKPFPHLSCARARVYIRVHVVCVRVCCDDECVRAVCVRARPPARTRASVGMTRICVYVRAHERGVCARALVWRKGVPQAQEEEFD